MSGEKRSQDCEDTLNAETVIIVDIEGTTTSISFVKEALFPHIRENLKQYIEKNWDAEEFKGDLEKLKEQAKKDETDKVEGVVSITGATPEEERESVVKNVLWQMDGDRKTGALKQLQGHMWREAYKSGDVKGHVYEDVPKAFDGWTKSGRKIYVYSSGSVEAQKLLFGHSEHGDMLKYFSDYFDTEIGAKQESSSYKNILAKIAVEPSSVLFITDVVKEAQAAKEAGITAKIIVRPGNAPLTDEDKVTFTTIESFMDLSFQTSAKRQKVEKSDEKEETTKPVTEIAEPMDTSEEAPVISIEKKIAEKEIEKIDETKKTIETTKPVETKIPEKSEVASMDVDGKVETDNKTAEIVDNKPVVIEETKKKEEESKTTEKIIKEVVSEVATVSDVAKKDSEIAIKDSEIAKKDTEIPKKDVEIAIKESEIANKVCEIAKTKCETVKKESEIVKIKDSETAKKESEATKTEATTTKLESEPMDEDKKILPSVSESIATITEDKTEASVKSSETVKTDKKTETEAKSVESVTEAKKESDVKMSEPSTDVIAESKDEKIVEKEETKGTVTIVQKYRAFPSFSGITPKTMGMIVTKENDEKSSMDETIKEDSKQNGGSTVAKDEKAQTVDKKTESNGDSKEETVKKEEVSAVETKAPVVEAEKKSETIAESASKDDKEIEKTKVDDAPTVESTDSKLNGTSEDSVKDKDEKPHRNGLNGDSTTEKSNGDTKEESVVAAAAAAAATTSSQNGEAESSTGSSAESIKTKKVVDSTIADGAGEPDVVPPVAVAATS